MENKGIRKDGPSKEIRLYYPRPVVGNEDNLPMPFVTLPLHVITVYLKGDLHHIAHQIPLEAVPTWDILESVLRHICNGEGQLVLTGYDDEALVIAVLWPYHLRSGAKFRFFYSPVVGAVIIDKAGRHLVALNIPEYEGVFYLRLQVYAFVKKLSPPFKCPPSAEALRLMNQISKDPLIEIPLQNGGLLADLVRDDKKTLTLVAPDLEGYTDEDEPLTMREIHAADQIVADDQRHESEDPTTTDIPEVALPVQETEHDKDVSEITELYTTQEIAGQEDFGSGNVAKPSGEPAHTAHDFTAGNISTPCDLRASDGAPKTPTKVPCAEKGILNCLLKRWETEGEDLAEKKRQYLAEYGQRQHLVQYEQPQHLVLTAESAKEADLTEQADVEYLAGLPEQADLEFLTSLHEGAIMMAASTPQGLAASEAEQADINFLNETMGLRTPLTMVLDAEATSVAQGLPANDADQADVDYLIEQMSLRTLPAKGQDDKVTSGSKELSEGDAEEADIEHLTGQMGIHTPPSEAQELDAGHAEGADIPYLIEQMWLGGPPAIWKDTKVNSEWKELDASDAEEADIEHLSGPVGFPALSPEPQDTKATSGDQALGAHETEQEDIKHLTNLMRFRTPPPKPQVASPVSAPQGLGAGLAVSTADISPMNDEAERVKFFMKSRMHTSSAADMESMEREAA